MKILLCGDINSGKSTLIQKLVSDIGKAPRGYITVRMPEDEAGVSHVYLYDISSPPERIEDAIVIMEIRGDKFDRRPEYMSSIAAPILGAFRRAASLFWTSWARLRSMRSASKMR